MSSRASRPANKLALCTRIYATARCSGNGYTTKGTRNKDAPHIRGGVSDMRHLSAATLRAVIKLSADREQNEFATALLNVKRNFRWPCSCSIPILVTKFSGLAPKYTMTAHTSDIKTADNILATCECAST